MTNKKQSKELNLSKVAIVVIGNEILSGRTQDKNINFIAGRCDKIGLDVQEVRIIPDVQRTIIKTVLELHKNFDYIFTTGGIGPTHDDITTESIAKAFGIETEVNKEALERLKKHYKNMDVELNKAREKMAVIPKGSVLIDNPVSSAPGFILKNVYVLPGVPKILQAMFLELEDKICGVTNIKSLNIVVYSAEGEIAEILNNVQQEYEEVSIGSYPYFQPPNIGTNVVLRSIDDNHMRNAGVAIKQKLVENKIKFDET